MNKERASRYSSEEVEVLVNCVEEHKAILLGSFTPNITSEIKEKTWAEITEKVNAVGKKNRTTKQIKKKWTDIASRTKCKAAQAKSGSGVNDRGDMPALTAIEEKITGVLGRTAVEGHEDGVDTFDDQEVIIMMILRVKAPYPKYIFKK